MLREILPEEAIATLERERVLLEKVQAFAGRYAPDGEESQRMAGLLRHLEDMFLLVVVGEVKAGKSAFINALLGTDVCPEGPLPLTDKVHVLGYGDHESQVLSEPHILRRTMPLEALRRMNVVDTPGTNSPLRRHQEITEAFLPRADIVFFVTSIDCPLTQTEIHFLAEIRQRWRKEVACILAKVDMRPEEDRAIVLEYLRDAFREHVGFSPPVFAVSATDARRARRTEDDALLARSGLPAVEAYIVENLSESRRVQLKLTSPLGTVYDVLAKIDADAAARQSALERDFAGWNAIVEQATFAGTSLKERSERHLAPLGVAFENLEARGRRFLRETIRLRSLRLVADGGRFRETFEREVVRSAGEEIERKAESAARWLGEETHALWERALAHLHATVPLERYRTEILVGTGPRFQETRQETLADLVEQARQAMAGWSVEGECRRIRTLASQGLGRVLGTEAVAAGLGATVAATLLPSVIGGVGLALAALVAIGGLFILPSRRQLAIERFEEAVRAVREAVLAAVREAIASEAERAGTAVLDAFAPFHDFYENRRRQLGELRLEAGALRDEVAALQADLA